MTDQPEHGAERPRPRVRRVPVRHLGRDARRKRGRPGLLGGPLRHARPLMEETAVRFPVVQGSAENAPFKDETFDLVFYDFSTEQAWSWGIEDLQARLARVHAGSSAFYENLADLPAAPWELPPGTVPTPRSSGMAGVDRRRRGDRSGLTRSQGPDSVRPVPRFSQLEDLMTGDRAGHERAR